MTFENILLEKKSSIAYVTVNRPKVLNALNMATMEELRAAFHDIKNDKNIRVVMATVDGFRIADVPPIVMDNLQVHVVDAFDQRHPIRIRQGERLTFGERERRAEGSKLHG